MMSTDTSSEKSRTLRNITHGLGFAMDRSGLVDYITSVCRLRNSWHTIRRVLSRRRAVLTLDMGQEMTHQLRIRNSVVLL
jgi:antitoxin component HigA of HigAB toxin-antitoxin module